METTKISLIDGVFEIAEKFMEKPTYVWLEPETIKYRAVKLRDKIKERTEHWLGYPKWLEELEEDEQNKNYMLLLYEVIAGAINYQYWYARHDVRPNGAGVTLMYRLLDESFEQSLRMIYPRGPREKCLDAIKIFMDKIILNRLPNIAGRIKHLNEIKVHLEFPDVHAMGFTGYTCYPMRSLKPGDIEKFIREVITCLPGYAEDIFLKRVFLLCMMLYRRTKWFKDDIHKVPIPADYQIPRVLRSLTCIGYHSLLAVKINGHELIPSGSLMECEIRAASILACKQLAEHSGCTMCDVDTYLWLNRNECKEPFHLTVTTDY